MLMQILEMKPKEGKVKVKIETLDDLWHLYHVVDEGDVVYAKTLRRQSQRADSLRAEKVEVIPVFIGLKVEKMSFHKFSNQLRLTGPIVYASREDVPLGKYHTITAGLGTILTIQKPKWKKYQIERLEEAERASKRAKLLIVVVDDGEADIAVVREYGIDTLGSIRMNIGGKRYNTDRESEKRKFFHEIARTIDDISSREDVEAVIVAGPGFYKEEFKKFLDENYPDMSRMVVLEDTSVTGKTGIYEVIKRGAVEKVYRDSRISKEINLVEKVLERISKGKGDVAYGVDEVEEAVNYGAVDTLLVLDELLKESNLRERIESLLESVRNLRGDVVVVSSEHEGGEKLKAIGGIAALLRFSIK